MTAKARKPAVRKPRQHDQQSEVDALFLSIGEGVFATDSEGRISRVNQAAMDILGFTRKELIGKWYPTTVVAEDTEGNVLTNLNRPIAQAFLSGQSVAARIYYRRKDESRVPVALNVSPILFNNKPVGAIEVFRDITDELSLEQAKDDFISIASHQLRTPATGAKQYMGMLLEGYAEELTPKQLNLLERAYQSNERQLQIIEDLLNVARVDAGNISLKYQKTDLIKLTGDVVHEQALKLKTKQLKLTFVHPQRTLSVEVDMERIRMVLENILDNAIKYTPVGRKIDIKAYKVQNWAIIKIYDQGVGIAEEDIDKLFQKFQRVPNPLSVEAGGTGLGLYWAERIVKLHGGRITVSSRLDRGSCFSIYLPLRRAKILTEN